MDPRRRSLAMGKLTAKEKKKQEKKKERWLLTRKTWRYMTDAGRKLVPEGHNKPEDIPKIEAYFQEVCQKEPRFLLWRKQSYPGALGFRRRNRNRKKGGSCRDKASSADEAETPPDRFLISAGSSPGRFDLQRMKREFLFGKSQPAEQQPPAQQEIVLLDTLQKYLYQDKALDPEELLQKLKQHLANIEKMKVEEKRRAVQFEGDPSERSLLETIRRYFGKSTNREKVISDLLTDRKKLEKLYFELRQARGFMAGSRGTSVSGRQGWKGTYHSQDNINDPKDQGAGYPLSQTYSQSVSHGLDRGYDRAGPSGYSGYGTQGSGYAAGTSAYGARSSGYSAGSSGYGAGASGYGSGYSGTVGLAHSASREFGRGKHLGVEPLDEESSTPESNTPSSPPPVIEIEPDPTTSYGTQTDQLTSKAVTLLEEELKRLKIAEAKEKEGEEGTKSPPKDLPRRSSLVDNDDVSPSVSDTIKRYLRMARKKSVDSDKADRFKRVNYDRNLRNIKAKGEITKISDDDGLDKGAQTDEVWVEAFKNLKMEYEPEFASSRSSLTEDTLSPTSPTSKSFLSSGQSFLSSLLHGLHDKSSASAGGMQKSKSSTSVVQQGSRLVARKIWKSRSKSQSRATPSATSTWTPQGNCAWSNVAGREITLTETMLHHLSELERRLLQKVAIAKLQALNLGVAIKLPSENPAPAVQKPKRRPHLLKRKAMTTAFDAARKEDKEKDGGMVFGVALGQCVENERLKMCLRGDLDEHTDLRRKSHHGSRSSFSSLIETPRPEEGGSCESLISPTLSMPGLDNLSCGSIQNLGEPTCGTGVPNIVTSCQRHLENFGLRVQGIFRVSSSLKRVRQLREEFDCGKEMNLEDNLCPHDVATLLKEYFRDLPDPLLCRDLYQAFIQTQRIRNRRLQQEALQHLIQLLPVAHRDTLWSLLNFLHLVVSNSTDKKDQEGQWITGNKMDSNNLATVFAPNLLRPYSTKSAKEELSAEGTEERSDAINVIRTLIDNHKILFQVSAELLDEVYVHMMDSHPEALDQLLRKRDFSNDELEDSGTCDDSEKKLWAREDFTHETAGMGGPELSMKSWRMDRGRERSSRRRKEEMKKRGESESSSRRTSASDEKSRFFSSDSGQHTPDEITSTDGVITASLKIPVPSSTSFSLNLDDIPYIEDSDKHHMVHGVGRGGSESGVGSMSRGGSSSWESGQTSPESEPSQRHHPTLLQRVTIHHTSQVQQVQPAYSRSDSHSTTTSTYKTSSDRISKSASTSAVSSAMPTEHIIPLAKEALASRLDRTTGIMSIGDRVMRSKTADIERMISEGRAKAKGATTGVIGNLEKEYKRKYTDSRHYTRHLQQEEAASQAKETGRGIWKRRELISSEPKERRNYY